MLVPAVVVVAHHLVAGRLPSHEPAVLLFHHPAAPEVLGEVRVGGVSAEQVKGEEEPPVLQLDVRGRRRAEVVRVLGRLALDEYGVGPGADDSDRRAAIAHVKYGGANQLSASAFHDLCGQAVKNLHVLTPHWGGAPKNVAAWNSGWTADGSAGTVTWRIRVPTSGLTAEQAWAEFAERVRHPGTRREVWLVMGAGLSLKVFEAECDKRALGPTSSSFSMCCSRRGTPSRPSGRPCASSARRRGAGRLPRRRGTAAYTASA